MAYREKESVHMTVSFHSTIIPRTVDGKHSAEIVLTDPRWPSEKGVPRPSLTVELERPFDVITGEAERKLKRAFEKSLIDFAALGVISTVAHRSRREKAPQTGEEIAVEPRAPVDLEAVLDALQRVNESKK